MLPRSFLTKCSSLLSLVLRAWVDLISALSSSVVIINLSFQMST